MSISKISSYIKRLPVVVDSTRSKLALAGLDERWSDKPERFGEREDKLWELYKRTEEALLKKWAYERRRAGAVVPGTYASFVSDEPDPSRVSILRWHAEQDARKKRNKARAMSMRKPVERVPAVQLNLEALNDYVFLRISVNVGAEEALEPRSKSRIVRSRYTNVSTREDRKRLPVASVASLPRKRQPRISVRMDVINEEVSLKLFSGTMPLVVCQSGSSKKMADRDERDRLQRLAAKKRERAVFKQLPKREREEKIKAARDKRSAVFQSGVSKAAPAIAICLTTVAAAVLRRGARSVRDGVSSILSGIESAVTQLKNILGNALWYIPLTCVFWYSFRTFEQPLVRVALLGALCTLLPNGLWDRISKFFQHGDAGSTDGVMLQSGGLYSVGQLLSTLCTFSAFSKGKIDQRSVSEFTKRISNFDRMSAGFSSFLDWFLEQFEKVVNYVLGAFSDKRVTFVKKANTPLLAWMREVDALWVEFNTQPDAADPEKLNCLVQAVITGSGFKEAYRGTPMVSTVEGYLIKARNLLQPYYGSLSARNNFRVEPVMSMLLGAPGVGKTLIMTPMAVAILMLSGIVKDTTDSGVLSQIWQKGTSEFWNGYAQQACLVMDDAFQQRADSKDKDNEFINVIRMIGCWAFPLNMADLESKGKIFFRSSLVLGTTNVSSITSEARIVLQEPEAVTRRINYPYCIEVKPEYRVPGTARLCMEKFEEEKRKCEKAEEPLNFFPWYIWTAHKHNFATGTTYDTAVGLDEIIVSIANDLKHRQENHTVARSDIGKFIARLRGDGVVTQQAGRSSEITPAEEEHNPKAARRELKRQTKEYERTSGSPFVRGILLKFGWCAAAALSGLMVMNFATTVRNIVSHNVREVCNLLWSTATLRFASSGNCILNPKTWINAESNKSVTVPQSNRSLAYREERARFCPQAGSPVHSNVYDNSYNVTVISKTASKYLQLGQLIMVDTDLAIMPFHFHKCLLREIKLGAYTVNDRVVLRSAVTASETSCTVGAFLKFPRMDFEDRDVICVKLTSLLRAHRRIIGNFIREDDIRSVPSMAGQLNILTVRVDDLVLRDNMHEVFHFGNPSLRSAPMRYGDTTLTRCWSYRANTRMGDCGAPLFITDYSRMCGRACYGFHIAFEDDPRNPVALGAIVTQEMLQQASKALKIVTDDFESDAADRGITLVQPQGGVTMPFTDMGSFLPICEVTQPASLSPNSKYYRVKAFDGLFGECTDRPAHLKPVMGPDGYIYPMENAVRPYSTPVAYYEQPWLRQAVYSATIPLFDLTKTVVRRNFTFEEAVIGVPGLEFRSLPRSTSPGYPYKLNGRNGKQQFFGDAVDYDLSGTDCEELRERVDHVLEQARKGVRCCHIFMDFLKDELRSKQKVDDVQTRLISSAPLDYTIAWRMLFGAFSAAFMRNHTSTGMAPGICTYTEWDTLARHLSQKGPHVFDGDFKGFDASEQPCIHDLILDRVNEWYGDAPDSPDAIARRVLWLDLTHSRHIGGKGYSQKYIYQWNKSLPSGHPFTTIINSIYSLVLLIGSYVHLTGDDVGFWHKVSPITYGDDNASNVDESIAKVYNQCTVAEALQSQFGLVYTPGRKDGVWQPTTVLENITFLKRGFKYESDEFGVTGRWLCPLEKTSFLHTLYWCKNHRHEKDIMCSNVHMALLELSHHAPQDWDTYVPLLMIIYNYYNSQPQASLDRETYQRLTNKLTHLWL